jgi:hypothetical protein
VRRDGRPFHRGLGVPGVALDEVPPAAGQRAQVAAPVAGGLAGHGFFPEHIVDHEADQGFLAGDVPVEGHGAGSQLSGDPAHGDRREPLGIGDAERRSGHLNGRTPGLPAGVLAWVAAHGQDRITWQPGPGLREAAVIEPYGGLHPGFVLAAQSLQGISGQQRSLTWSIAYLWLAAFAISFLIARLHPARTTRPRHPIL